MVGDVQGVAPEDQQERLKDIGWVVGFVDGEGCFSMTLEGLAAIALDPRDDEPQEALKFLRILRDHTPAISIWR